jgi:hypothetical protein
MPADDFLSFPPDTLVREPLRLPIVARGEGWLVLNKPVGVPWTPDPWIPRPTDLVREVRSQIRAGKPALARRGRGASTASSALTSSPPVPCFALRPTPRAPASPTPLALPRSS